MVTLVLSNKVNQDKGFVKKTHTHQYTKTENSMHISIVQ